MYLPRYFRQNDLHEIHALIAATPLATLVTVAHGKPSASHLPMIFDAARGELGTLRCHVARANEQWRSIADGDEALAMFLGPSAYVSPSWLASTREHGKVVPTWNYVAVHATGTARVIHEPAELHELVATLTDRHEDGRPKPWSVDDAPREYVTGMLGAIVGIEIAIERLEGKWKLEQNCSAADIDGAIAGLEATAEPGARATASEMRRACPGDRSPGRQ